MWNNQKQQKKFSFMSNLQTYDDTFHWRIYAYQGGWIIVILIRMQKVEILKSYFRDAWECV